MIMASKTIKAMMGESGEWELDVLGVPYGGPYGGKDAQGEFFTPATDLWLERIPRRPVVYYHGLAEAESAPQIIGEELGWERRADGVWFRVALDKASRLARRVWQAAQKGLARASSGAIGHLVRVAEGGQIVVWPVCELSLLDARQHQPANPYAVALPQVKAVFEAMGLSISDFGLQIEDRQGEDEVQMDEQTIRNIMRQEITTALEDAGGESGPAGMFLTGQVPALINERGEKPLTAYGTPFVDAIKALRQGRFDVVRFQLSGKALSEGTDSAGGYLVPVEHSNKLIEILSAKTAVRAAGATVIPMISDTLQIPSQTGGATAYWVADRKSTRL